MAKDELVLLYQLDGTQAKGALIREILSRLGIRVKTVSPDQLNETIGALAELPGFSLARAAKPTEPAAVRPTSSTDLSIGSPSQLTDSTDSRPSITEEVMLMNNLSDSRIERILKEFRESGVSRIALKAVVTSHNRTWTLLSLIQELQSEHEIMSRYTLLNQQVQVASQLLSQQSDPAASDHLDDNRAQVLTTVIAEAKSILRASEAPELPVLDATLARLSQVIAAYQR